MRFTKRIRSYKNIIVQSVYSYSKQSLGKAMTQVDIVFFKFTFHVNKQPCLSMGQDVLTTVSILLVCVLLHWCLCAAYCFSVKTITCVSLTTLRFFPGASRHSRWAAEQVRGSCTCEYFGNLESGKHPHRDIWGFLHDLNHYLSRNTSH